MQDVALAKQLQEQQLRAAHAARVQQAQAQHLAARQAAAAQSRGLQGLGAHQLPPQQVLLFELVWARMPMTWYLNVLGDMSSSMAPRACN